MEYNDLREVQDVIKAAVPAARFERRRKFAE
jgi:hypothetical protein